MAICSGKEQIRIGDSNASLASRSGGLAWAFATERVWKQARSCVCVWGGKGGWRGEGGGGGGGGGGMGGRGGRGKGTVARSRQWGAAGDTRIILVDGLSARGLRAGEGCGSALRCVRRARSVEARVIETLPLASTSAPDPTTDMYLYDMYLHAPPTIQLFVSTPLQTDAAAHKLTRNAPSKVMAKPSPLFSSALASTLVPAVAAQLLVYSYWCPVSTGSWHLLAAPGAPPPV
ncbi:hypothetical protein BDZ91DRAFT_825317 [Kalaharituber pfeilii]|nr:hypothetical protein BDZ91DRAFT_825317 [Kalaharituber pfeilii]